jgi:hypothetical protein
MKTAVKEQAEFGFPQPSGQRPDLASLFAAIDQLKTVLVDCLPTQELNANTRLVLEMNKEALRLAMSADGLGPNARAKIRGAYRFTCALLSEDE